VLTADSVVREAAPIGSRRHCFELVAPQVSYWTPRSCCYCDCALTASGWSCTGARFPQMSAHKSLVVAVKDGEARQGWVKDIGAVLARLKKEARLAGN
jgi:hypothetical protein